MESDPRISIVVPVYRGGEKFRRCLASVAALSMRPHELIVVCDGGDDGSEEAARAAGARVLHTPRPRSGPAVARNLGARDATGDLLFFIDADVTLPPDTLEVVQRTFRQHPHIAGCIGSYDDAPGEPNLLSQYKNLLHHHIHQRSKLRQRGFWGACGVIRRPIFLALHGFDERFGRPCIEDIELGYRVTQAGHILLLEKSLQVKHLKKWTPWSLLKTDFYDRALPWTRLMLKNKWLENDLNLSRRSRASAAASYLLLISLLLSIVQPWLLLAAAALAATLVYVHRVMLGFFARKRGWLFAAGCAVWHWFYYLYGGAGFVLGALLYYLDALFQRRQSPWAAPAERLPPAAAAVKEGT